MRKMIPTLSWGLFISLTLCAQSGSPQSSQPSMPYTPSLDVNAMDKSVDPCVDFYQYSCGGWKKNNPIPPDETSWEVYRKLYRDNLNYLRGILEQAASATAGDAVTQKIGDFYGACMDESAVEKRGLSAVKSDLDLIAGVESVRAVTP
jgi:putative endopeptidase